MTSALAQLQDDSLVVQERYLGLHMPHEMDALQTLLLKLSDWVETNLDMLQVIQTAATAQVPSLPPAPQQRRSLPHGRPPVRIGVAQDCAFAFYYNE